MLKYWLARWDWECPTLFGIERDDLQALAATWPSCLAQQPKAAAQALAGALRETLHGASAPTPQALPQLIGINHAEATALQGRIWPQIEAFLG
ncbi:MAG: hypothetical protein ACOY4U_11275 [Pseudomonadota bacterium]